ncbi:helix-turn-helix domain-containing protein [Campylobacter suis]|uniref:DNA-binding protein n=1 Tax=Campylobacter suis TaxID=2790657 RepID=A0ABM8Q8X1_9BACT|nr:helix-turn-helix domain-containing protein [Campylobacter suis]CAD7289422.1 hypothetical protein LMG8286_01803 [Campylobacter suis]
MKTLELITPDDLYRLYGIPLQTQAKWRMEKGGGVKIPFIKLGRRIFYNLASIEEFILGLEKIPGKRGELL